jgi:hypothetical protein
MTIEWAGFFVFVGIASVAHKIAGLRGLAALVALD